MASRLSVNKNRVNANRMTIMMVASVLLLCGSNSSAHASDTADNEPEENQKHRIEAFMGGAVRSHDTRTESGFVESETESGFVLGLDYEYKPHPMVGLGALVEVATGDLRDVIVMAPLSLHPWRGLRLMVAPGLEVRDDTAEFLFRIGTNYTFPIGIFEVGPEFDVDIVNSHPTYIVGMAFGIGF